MSSSTIDGRLAWQASWLANQLKASQPRSSSSSSWPAARAGGRRRNALSMIRSCKSRRSSWLRVARAVLLLFNTNNKAQQVARLSSRLGFAWPCLSANLWAPVAVVASADDGGAPLEALGRAEANLTTIKGPSINGWQPDWRRQGQQMPKAATTTATTIMITLETTATNQKTKSAFSAKPKNSNGLNKQT